MRCYHCQKKQSSPRERNLFLFRHIPGAGSTTAAEALSGGRYPVIAADDYFHRLGRYDKARLPAAHKECLARTEAAMRARMDNILVTNTMITNQQLKPYYDIAEYHGYRVFSFVVENRHQGESVHDVPEAVLEEYKKKLRASIIL